MCSAMTRRTPRSGSRRPSPPPTAAVRTSSSVIRPPDPLPEMSARSTPSSCAIRRTTGVAWTRPPDVGAAGDSARSRATATGASTTDSPGIPITTSSVPTGTTSPSATSTFRTVPAYGDGISTVALSVWISTSGSSSPICWPSATSQRATSPSVSPSPRSGSLKSYAMVRSSLEPDSVVRQHRVDTLGAVHELSDPQVDDDAREGKLVSPLEAVLPRHQLDHRVGCRSRSLVEVLVEAEGDPRGRCPGDRGSEPVVVANREGQLGTLHGTLDGELRHLAVTLASVSVPGGEEGAVHGNRQVQLGAGDELLAVDVPAPHPRRLGGVDARFGRRHAEHAEKRPQRDLATELISTRSAVWIERPPQPPFVAAAHAQPIVERRLPAARLGDPPGADTQRVDPHLERLPGRCATDLDRPDHRVTAVELRLARLEAFVGEAPPAGIEARERDRVPRVDRQHRLEIAREVPVQRPPLEWDLVDHVGQTRVPRASNASNCADAAGVSANRSRKSEKTITSRGSSPSVACSRRRSRASSSKPRPSGIPMLGSFAGSMRISTRSTPQISKAMRVNAEVDSVANPDRIRLVRIQ